MIRHLSLNNLIFNLQDGMNLNDSSRFARVTSPVFDASVLDFFGTLASGASLHVMSKVTRKDPQLLVEFLRDHEITHADIASAMVDILPYEPLPKLQNWSVGGQRLSQAALERWMPGRNFINGYGPTETTVRVVWRFHQPGDQSNNIGQMMKNTEGYVLDEDLNPVGVGELGQLFVGGLCVAAGYWRRDDMTQERFIENPWACERDKELGFDRMYATGDLVRWLPDGNLEFAGRDDNQVKIRGFRVELGEIEQALNLMMPSSKLRCSCAILVRVEERSWWPTIRYRSPVRCLN